MRLLLEVVDRLDVGVPPHLLRVGDEDDAVDALQDQLARRVVEHLARHGVEVESGAETADRAQLDGQEVEEQGAVGLRGQGDQLALGIRSRVVSWIHWMLVVLPPSPGP